MLGFPSTAEVFSPTSDGMRGSTLKRRVFVQRRRRGPRPNGWRPKSLATRPMTRNSVMIEDDLELVIFDADGTLRYVTVPGQHYPLRPEEWRLMPGVRETLAALPV